MEGVLSFGRQMWLIVVAVKREMFWRSSIFGDPEVILSDLNFDWAVNKHLSVEAQIAEKFLQWACCSKPNRLFIKQSCAFYNSFFSLRICPYHIRECIFHFIHVCMLLKQRKIVTYYED